MPPSTLLLAAALATLPRLAHAQGTFNSLSAGMLLYISMYTLIGEEFSRQDLNTKPRLRWSMYAAVLLGAACMAVIGVWA